MRVARDIVGSLEGAYVDKGIIKKLDKHEALGDLDVCKLIGGMFSAGYMAKRKNLHLADPFNSYRTEETREERISKLHNLSDVRLAQSLNEQYAHNQIIKRNPWSDEEFQHLMMELANRWQQRASKQAKLDF